MGHFIDQLIGAAIRHRRLVIGATAALAALGIRAFATLTTDAFPDLTPNQVLVMTTVPGLSPTEVEQQVTYPMEVAMLGLPRTTEVRSKSKSALSVVTVGFEDGVDFYFARALVQQRMQDARGTLPEAAEVMLGPPATAMGEILQYLVESSDTADGSGATDTLRLLALTNAQEYIIRPLLRTIPGVADVNSWGGMHQQFEVQVDPVKLAGFELTFKDLEDALARNNANFGGGYLEDRGDRLTLRGLGRVADTTGIGLIVVATRGATPVHIRDVARVTLGPALRYGAVTRDARGEALSATILMLKGSNGRDVADRVMRKLEEIQPLLPPGIRVRPFYSQGDVVARTTHTVFRNLIEGGLLVLGILLLFLRNLRASLLTASIIPLSLLGAFLAMKQFGMSANLMSLGALDFGLIVDASVVMVENMLRRRTVLDAAVEVGRPVAFGILIIVAVYAPLTALEGLERKMFVPMAFTVCAAILVSLLLALSFVPAAASYLFPGGATAEHRADAGWFVALKERYRHLLEWALAHPGQVATGAGVLLAGALVSVPYLGSEFMPKLDEGYLLIENFRVPSAGLAQGTAVSLEVERTLLRFPEVQSVVTNLGRPQEATEAMALTEADAYVLFKPKREWRAGSLDEVIAGMDSALAEIPGVEYEFSAPMRMRLDEVVSGVKTDLGIKIFGDSLELLQTAAATVEGLVRGIRGAEDVSVAVSQGALQLELGLDRAAMARYGLSVEDVQSAVASGVGGIPVSEVVEGRRRYPIVVRLEPAYRSTPEAVGRILLRTPTGGTVTLSQVAELRTVEGPEVINHEGGQRYVVVRANVRGRDLGGLAAEVQRVIGARLTLPPGYYIDYGGQFENQQRASRRLLLIVPLVLLLIAGLLYASFGVLRHALLVMLNVPFALVGGIAALWLRGMHLNLSASVGMIAVFGVAILNGLVLITTVNHLRTGGETLEEAVRAGALVRLRPVLATALVASVGFLPMALSTSSGAEVQKPLATVVIGGLISATLLTLLVLPTVYRWLEGRRIRNLSLAG
ncbi:MAG TPA: CusA/CzcA family heavy metal efflux RND transporter [Gemmatimonadales bacterium]|jgi:cobalt-zinc-cadmium resistance protein CzcA|nr:CusA/CzcA family heavy metal efflux RND transporter [Gemmatimonadales bacterium]